MPWQLHGAADTATPLLKTQGFCLLSASTLANACATTATEFQALNNYWNDLPPDRYLRDGGHYRSRRHSCFVQNLETHQLAQSPHRAHWQPTTYNALHGGIERWFEPMNSKMIEQPAWPRLLMGLGRMFAAASLDVAIKRWFIEAHAFRIDTADGVGRPTPEGAHRDGVDYVAVIMIDRHNVRGGETRVFEANGERGIRFTLSEPWSALLMDDARVIHETTPIQPDGATPHRDTLVLTYRANGFQSPGT